MKMIAPFLFREPPERRVYSYRLPGSVNCTRRTPANAAPDDAPGNGEVELDEIVLQLLFGRMGVLHRKSSHQ